MSEGADILLINGRVFRAFGPREIVPYGSDIGPRPVAGANSVAIVGGRIALGRPPGRWACASGRAHARRSWT